MLASVSSGLSLWQLLNTLAYLSSVQLPLQKSKLHLPVKVLWVTQISSDHAIFEDGEWGQSHLNLMGRFPVVSRRQNTLLLGRHHHKALNRGNPVGISSAKMWEVGKGCRNEQHGSLKDILVFLSRLLQAFVTSCPHFSFSLYVLTRRTNAGLKYQKWHL